MTGDPTVPKIAPAGIDALVRLVSDLANNSCDYPDSDGLNCMEQHEPEVDWCWSCRAKLALSYWEAHRNMTDELHGLLDDLKRILHGEPIDE